MGEATITDLDFADDIVIFTETLEVLVGALDTLMVFGGEIWCCQIDLSDLGEAY